MNSPFTKIIAVVLFTLSSSLLWGFSPWSGDGTADNPFQITTRAHLQQLATGVNGGTGYANTHFKLMNDIDMTTGFTSGQDSSFAPIGTYVSETNYAFFAGHFDGDSHIITALAYNDTSRDYAGLFAGLNSGGTIKNLSITGFQITGKDQVGALCGINKGTITNVHITGKITGSYRVGGLCGYNTGAIMNSSAEISLSGAPSIGGFCGTNNGTITECSAAGTINGTSNNAGGFCGINFGTITNSSTAATVTGTSLKEKIGGFCGSNTSTGKITDCYASGATLGTIYIGGFCGYNEGTISDAYATGKVIGRSNTGGFCGDNSSKGIITNAYAKGEVEGSYGRLIVGGFCGSNEGTITSAYATGMVSGENIVGGFCGSNEGTITSAYAMGKVTGTSGVGGFCGSNTNTIVNAYYDTTKSECSDTGKGIPLATDKIVIRQDFVDSLNGTVGADTPFKPTNMLVNGGYPVLHSQSVIPLAFDGTGEQSNPFQIKTRADLETLMSTVNDSKCAFAYTYFKLMNDIDMAEGIIGDSSFTPIGYYVSATNYTPFTGYFDGGSHIISNLYINVSYKRVGLFGYNIGTIINLGLENIEVSGGAYVGGLCGDNTGAIINCYATGTVTGIEIVGGLCGYNNGSFLNCYATGTVSGTTEVGGFFGKTSYRYTVYGDELYTITSCYATGTVSGTDYVGGFCGNAAGGKYMIMNCYARGNVSGTNYVGGFCGNVKARDIGITYCYAAGTVSGTTNVGGFRGYADYDILFCYYDKDVSGKFEESVMVFPLSTSEMILNQDFVDSLNELGRVNTNKSFRISTQYVNDGYPILNWQNIIPFVLEGEGTPNDPYQIKTRADLKYLTDAVNAKNSEFKNTYFKLMNDIDMTEGIVGDSSFAPIGYYTSGADNALFNGHFDGDSHIIRNLYIDGAARNYCTALFAMTGSNAVVQNLHLENAEVTGNNQTALLIGQNNGRISNCSVTGTVSGTLHVGGLCGYNLGTVTRCAAATSVKGTEFTGGLIGQSDGSVSLSCASSTVTGTQYVGGLCGCNNRGTITNCYAMGAVAGINNVGGLCGWNQLGTITNAYAAGTITGVLGDISGLCGNNTTGTITNCYYDMTTSGYSDPWKGIPLTTAEMVLTQTFVDSLNGTSGSDSPFNIANLYTNNAYPILYWQGLKTFPFDGSGMPNDPHQIKTRADLKYLADAVNAKSNDFKNTYFKLMNDIDMTEGVVGDSSFAPIGYYTSDTDNAMFNGHFDGDSHVIRNLYINGAARTYCTALFAMTGSNAVIQNLHLENAEVGGTNQTAILIGQNNGRVSNCNVTGTVSGVWHVGGLCGYNLGTITRCAAVGTIYGTQHVGGLIGQSDSTVSLSYASGQVTGMQYVGGFCGTTGSTITNAYAAGTVTGTSNVGGFCGWSVATITNCYYDMITSGYSDIGKGIPLTTAEMVLTQTFVDSLNSAVGTDSPFKISSTITNAGYPVFYWQTVVPTPVPPPQPFDDYRSVAAYMGSRIAISTDSFVSAAFSKKTKFTATYPNPNGGKDKKLKVQYSADGGDYLVVKGKVPLYNKKELKALKNGNTAFTYDILQSLIQKPVAITVQEKGQTDSALTIWALPPIIDTATLFTVDSLFSDHKDSYLILRASYAEPTNTIVKGEFENKGKIKSVKCAVLKKKTLTKFLTNNTEANSIYNLLTSTALEHEHVIVIKLNRQFIKGAAARFDIVVDNKNGLDAAILRTSQE